MRWKFYSDRIEWWAESISQKIGPSFRDTSSVLFQFSCLLLFYFTSRKSFAIIIRFLISELNTLMVRSGEMLPGIKQTESNWSREERNRLDKRKNFWENIPPSSSSSYQNMLDLVEMDLLPTIIIHLSIHSLLFGCKIEDEIGIEKEKDWDTDSERRMLMQNKQRKKKQRISAETIDPEEQFFFGTRTSESMHFNGFCSKTLNHRSSLEKR